jgi:Flp pilus assembly protein TadB
VIRRRPCANEHTIGNRADANRIEADARRRAEQRLIARAHPSYGSRVTRPSDEADREARAIRRGRQKTIAKVAAFGTVVVLILLGVAASFLQAKLICLFVAAGSVLGALVWYRLAPKEEA